MMAFDFNTLKKYDDILELNYLSERERNESLKRIFERDISKNSSFKFKNKTIRPIKIDGEPALETLFQHLTCQSNEQVDENGRKYKSRNVFDIRRAERLHWIWHHIQEKEDIRIFSFKDRVKGKNVIRTYLFDEKEEYVIVLEPYRKTPDYYLLSAYYLEKKYGGPKTIRKKYKRRLGEVY
ncbi:MAG: hypothetical protein ACTHY4_10080 [Flavobacteriaceae bacterium]